MTAYQPQTPVELTRRTEKRLNSLERRANPNWRISQLEAEVAALEAEVDAMALRYGHQSVIPTITGTGAVLSDGGRITLTAVTAVSITLPTSTYEDFLIIGKVSGSAGLLINARVRSGGSDDATAVYDRQVIAGSAASAVSAQSLAQTSIAVTDGSAGVSRHNFKMEIYDLGAASPTSFLMEYNVRNTSTHANVRASVGGTHRTSSAWTGVSFIPSTGNITGSFRVFGLNNNIL